MSDRAHILVGVTATIALLLAGLAAVYCPPLWWRFKHLRRQRRYGGYLTRGPNPMRPSPMRPFPGDKQ